MAALLAAAALALTACAGSDDKGEPDDGGDRGASLATTSDADWKPVADILGRTGKLNDGSVYKIGFARSDLSVQTKGVTVAPALSLGSWVAFARTPDGQTMLMGDLVVTEDELASVTDAVQAGGLQQTALHKHLLEQSPPIWWTHIAGHGDAADLARAVRSALDATDTPPPASATSGQTSLDLDTAAIDEALGRSGTIAGGVYKFFIARRDPVTMSGMLIPPSMGLATALNFQPTGNGRAAINGDFVMTAAEVQDVVQALRGGESTSSPYTTTGSTNNHACSTCTSGPRTTPSHSPARYAPRWTPPRPGDPAPRRIPTRREPPVADVVMQASCDDVLVQWAMFGRDPRHGTVAWNASATVATLCRVEPGLPTVAR